MLGYGSQGHAHALNLRDSGVDVRVGWGGRIQVPREGRGRRPARGLGGRGLEGGRPDSTRRSTRPRRKKTPRGYCARAGEGEGPLLRPRVRRPLRPDSARRPRWTWCWCAQGLGHLVRRQFQDGRGIPLPDRRPAGREAGGPSRWASPTPRESAAPGPACSRPRSRRRPRPIPSASRRSCAAGARRWSRPASETLVEAGYQPRAPDFERTLTR